jgi:hypothetical protein
MYQVGLLRSSTGLPEASFSFWKCMKLGFCFLLGVLLFVDMACPRPSPAAEPASGAWRWDQVLHKYNSMSDSAASGCIVWMEKYSTSSYRSWSRCGVSNSVSGIHYEAYFFPNSFSQPIQSAAACNAGGCSNFFNNGNGTLANGSTTPVGYSPVHSGQSITAEGGVLAWAGTSQVVHTNSYTTCSGEKSSGDDGVVVGGNPLLWSTSGFLRDTSTAANTLSSTCTNADTLGNDFGNVVADCHTQMTITGGPVNGRQDSLGDCGCIPVGYGIESYSEPNICHYRPLSGDPARPGSGVGSIGGTIYADGHTFTNDDLNTTAEGGPGGIPITGGFLPPGGGNPSGYGYPPGHNGQVTPPIIGTGGGGVGGGGGGGGSGGGGGTCQFTNCNSDGTEDVYTPPDSPTYDGSVAAPTELDWTQQVTSFISSSPAIAAINGSGIEASGDCSLSASVYGGTVDLGFCNIPSSLFTVMSAALLSISYLVAFFIIFR